MGWLDLRGNDWQRINGALGSSYDLFALNQFVTTKFPVIAAGIPWMSPGGMSDVVFRLVETSNQHGLLDQLLSAAADGRPYRPDLRALTFDFSQRPGWSAPVSANGLDVRGTLEGLTSPGNPFMDTTTLATWMVRVERRVCLVNCGGEGGTGWLVGPDLVLTCHHVVRGHLNGTVPAGGVRVKFDFRRTPAQQNPQYDGPEWIGIDPNWNIPNSPHSPADLSLAGDPAPNELDFALLKLNQQLGAAVPPGETTPRGWVNLSADPPLPVADTPMLIVQHPQNDTPPPSQMPLQVAFATPGFQGANGNGTRLIYSPSTRRGSSGSPVFDRTFAAVALHHNRGQISPQAADLHRNNRGIPLGLIRAALPTAVRQTLLPPPE